MPTYPRRYPNTPTYLPSLHLYDPISTFLLFRSFTFIFLHVHLIPTPISMYTHTYIYIYIYIYLGNYKSLALRLFIYTPYAGAPKILVCFYLAKAIPLISVF